MPKILIMAKDPIQRHSNSRLAEKAGWKNFEIFVAASESVAEALIAGHTFDAATCEGRMPMSEGGFEVMRRLRHVSPRSRILCVATSIRDDCGHIGADAVRYGADTLISTEQEGWRGRLVYELKVALSLARSQVPAHASES